jgi:hypothetical protein
MTSSNATRGSKIRTPKPGTSSGDLAERFLELLRLRKKVFELEKSLAGDCQQGAGGDRTDLAGHQK